MTTILVLLLYFAIAFAPKVPWFAKVGAQLVLGAVIYFGPFKETEFALPKLGSMYGGNAFDIMDGVAFISMGVIGTALGLIATVIATIIYAIVAKKKA